jgi:surface antigen
MVAAMRRALILILPFTLAACAGSVSPRTGANLAYAHRYPGLTCAPFARRLVGFQLRGDAADWWQEAAGRYERTHRPQVGSVLVFRRARRVPSGHVSVVSRVLDARRILVIQANWVRGELDEDQLVVDVSPHNDWTAVRVWYPPANRLGTHVYSTYGFIVPPAPPSHDVLVAGAEPAARTLAGD